MLKKLLIIFLALFVLGTPKFIHAQGNIQLPQNSEQDEAVVAKIITQKEITVTGKKQIYQKLDLLITKGNNQNRHLIVENGNIPIANEILYHQGDNVIVTISGSPDGTNAIYISDYVRTTPLYLLFAVFVFLAILVGQKRGLSALIGMGISFLVIFAFVLPQILAGHDPTLL